MNFVHSNVVEAELKPWWGEVAVTRFPYSRLIYVSCIWQKRTMLRSNDISTERGLVRAYPFFLNVRRTITVRK